MDSTFIPGWAASYLPVSTGSAPSGTVTLAELSAPGKIRQLAPLLAETYREDLRFAALTIMHFAVGAVTNLLVNPLIYDGIVAKVDADQLGIVLKDDGNLCGLWIDTEFMLLCEADVQRLGTNLATLLNPIVDAVHAACQGSKMGIRLVMFDAISRGCMRIERTNPLKSNPDWVEELLDGMGDPFKKTPRTFIVNADDGPAIKVAIPRVCCMLSHHTTAHSCPSCPQHSPEDRSRLTEIWLRSLDDQGFLEETGRPRIG